MRKIPGVYEENGYTKVRIWLGPKRNPDGSINKPYRRSLGVYNNANIQLAKTHIEKTREAFKAGIMPGNEPEPLPVPLACDAYFKRDWVDNPKRTRRSVRNTGYGIERFKDYWRARAWHTLLPMDIEAYVAARKKLGIKDNTINRELALLSAMFTKVDHWVERREFGPYLLPTNTHGETYNPVEYVSRASTIESKRERVASNEELLKVKIYCDRQDPDMLEIILRAMITGLRQGDLERVNGHADVRGMLSKSREKKLFRFPLDFSHKLNYKNFRRRWNDLRVACDMEDFHWHDWRHTSGTTLYILGFTLEQIRQFYGHATIEQTMDYINLGKESLRPHVEALQGHMAKLLAKAPAPQLAAPVDPNIKICRGCHQPKDRRTDFSKHSAAGDGLNSRCRKCTYEAVKAARAANPNLRVREYAGRRLKVESIEQVVCGYKSENDTMRYLQVSSSSSVPGVSNGVSKLG